MKDLDMSLVDDDKVLLVVAEEQVGSILAELLQRRPVRICQALTVEGALGLAGEVRPDVIIIDGDLDGIDPTMSCRVFNTNVAVSAVPVIILVTPESDRTPFLQAGFDIFLAKPLVQADVVALLRRYVTLSERLNIRIPYYTPVTIEANNEHYFGMTGDMSTGGLFIAALDRFPESGELRLTFRLVNKEPQLVEVLGRIAWVNSKEYSVTERLPEGFGVQFVSIGAKELHAIREYIAASEK